MATTPISKVTQCLRQTLLSNEGPSDGQLLERFVSCRDEAALEAIIRRHGPMVWGVCRRLLNHHDAENAFQAAFLVLVRKAAAIVPRDMVGNWLYGVARQTALKARATIAIRLGRERQVTQMPDQANAEGDPWRGLQPLLDQELSRLPDNYRVAIILCDLEGRTRKEAARQLGLPEGTVASRLTRARRLLAKRFVRHGLVLSAGALGVALSHATAAARLPAMLVPSTVQVVSAVAAGKAAAAGLVSTRVAALTEGVVQAMFITKLKTIAAMLLALTLLAGGLLGYRAWSADQQGTAQETRTEETPVGQQENHTTQALADDKIKSNQAAEKFFHVDLQPKANQKLTDNFGSGREGNNLNELPKGDQTFEKIRFKIEGGVLQLNSKHLKEQKTHMIEGIKVGQTFTKLHILHATCYGSGKETDANFVADDTPIGAYKLHYDDGGTATVPIVYGQDVRDFWFKDEIPGVTRGKVAWMGENDLAKKFNYRIRLYLTSWDNPSPQKPVTAIDYVKLNGTPTAPFCVAISLQQK